MDYREIDARDRRLVIVVSPELASSLLPSLKWDPAKDGNPPLATSTSVVAAALLEGLGEGLASTLGILVTTAAVIGGAALAGPIAAVAFGTVAGKVLGNKKDAKPKIPPYPIFELKLAREQFEFPTNHPIDGLVYACCDAEPNHYVPLASFHRYMYELKMGAFQKLCSNLGARHASILYAEEDGRDITAQIVASGIPTQVGPASVTAEAGSHHQSSERARILARFPQRTRPLRKTESGWMNGEPTWRTMQEIRLEDGVDSWEADFSYTDDMGVRAEVAGKILGMNLKIGGEFEKIHPRKWKFEVEFWPILG